MGNLIIKRRKSRSPQVGDMRDRIVIQEREMKPPSFDSAAFEEVLSEIATVWAKLETLKGDMVFDEVSEVSTGGGVTAGATHLFSIRYRDDVTYTNIISFAGNNYKILLAENPELRNRWLFLYCKLLGDKNIEANK